MSGKESKNGASKEGQSQEYESQVTMRVMKSPTGYREVSLDMQNWKLGDEGLRETLTPVLRRRLQAKVSDLRPEDPWHYVNVDLSNNNLGPEGAEILCNFLRTTHQTGVPCYVRTLKLYKNKLGDEGMKHVAAVVLTQPEPVHEIHLSHNDITAVGAVTLVLALGQIHPQEAYPMYIPPKYERWSPCWCRLEKNMIEQPVTVLKALQRSGDVRVIETTRKDKEWGPLRSPSTCRNLGDVPHAILHIFSDQQTSTSTSAKVNSDNSKSVDDIICRANEVLFDFLSEDVQKRTEEKLRSTSGNSLPRSKPLGLVKRVDAEMAKNSALVKRVDLEKATHSVPDGHQVPCSTWWQKGGDEVTAPPSDAVRMPIVGQKLDPQALFTAAAAAEGGLPSELGPRDRSGPESHAAMTTPTPMGRRAEKYSPVPSDDDIDPGRMTPGPRPRTDVGAGRQRTQPSGSDNDSYWENWSREVAKDEGFRIISRWKKRVTPEFYAKCTMQIEVAKNPVETARRINATAERLEAQGYLRAPNETTESMVRMGAVLYQKYIMKMQHQMFSRTGSRHPGWPPGVLPALWHPLRMGVEMRPGSLPGDFFGAHPVSKPKVRPVDWIVD